MNSTQIIQFNINQLFTHIYILDRFYLIYGWGPITYYHSGLEWTWE